MKQNNRINEEITIQKCVLVRYDKKDSANTCQSVGIYMPFRCGILPIGWVSDQVISCIQQHNGIEHKRFLGVEIEQRIKNKRFLGVKTDQRIAALWIPRE